MKSEDNKGCSDESSRYSGVPWDPQTLYGMTKGPRPSLINICRSHYFQWQQLSIWILPHKFRSEYASKHSLLWTARTKISPANPENPRSNFWARCKGAEPLHVKGGYGGTRRTPPGTTSKRMQIVAWKLRNRTCVIAICNPRKVDELEDFWLHCHAKKFHRTFWTFRHSIKPKR